MGQYIKHKTMGANNTRIPALAYLVICTSRYVANTMLRLQRAIRVPLQKQRIGSPDAGALVLTIDPIVTNTVLASVGL